MITSYNASLSATSGILPWNSPHHHIRARRHDFERGREEDLTQDLMNQQRRAELAFVGVIDYLLKI